MVGKFEIEGNLAEVARRYRKNGPVHTALGNGFAKALSESAGRWEHKMKREQFVGYTPGRLRSPHRDRLQSRSGRHRQLIGFRRFGGRSWNAAVVLRSAGPGSRAQEYGAVITGNPWLSIPLPHTLTPSGARVQAKYRTWKWFGSRWATRFGPTWIRPSKSTPGNLVVFGRVSRTRVEALRVLTRRVVLPGPKSDGQPSRLGFQRAWESLRKERLEGMQKVVRNVNLNAIAGS